MKRALKNLFAFFIVISFILGSLLFIPKTTLAYSADFNGDGTEESPYLITSIDELRSMAYLDYDNARYKEKNYKLTTDLDLSNIEWKPIGTPSNRFSGVFDGDGHTISGFYAKYSEYTGLFGYVRNTGVIKNITLYGTINDGDSDLTEGASVGGIVGHLYGTVSHCTSYVDISINRSCSTGLYVGGICGSMESEAGIGSCANYGIISVNCESTSNGEVFVGGICGYSIGGSYYAEGTINACTNKQSINCATQDTDSFVGGIIGKANNTKYLVNCYNTGTITGISSCDTDIVNTYVGGIAGEYYVGADIWDHAVPALDRAHLSETYNLGALSANSDSDGDGFYGYIAGSVSDGYIIENSYYTSSPGQGTRNTVRGETYLDEEAMKEQSSFEGFNFSISVGWKMVPNSGYPYPVLGWEYLHSHVFVNHPAVSVTCTKNGNTEYWECTDCNKYFSDANGENEIEEESWIIPATGHTEEVRNAVAPTETSTGYSGDTYCSVCGKLLYTGYTIPKLGGDENDQTWDDPSAAIETMTLVGGTEDDPVVIEVNGTILVNGTITVTSGYVIFTEGEGYEGVLQKGTSCMRILTVKYGAHVTINGLDFQSSSNRNTYGVIAEYGSYVDVINTNISGFDSGISTGGYLNVSGGTISGCKKGIATGANSLNHISNCQITGNEYGIYNNSSWYDYIEDGTYITNNSSADFYAYATSFGLYVQGAFEIEKADFNQKLSFIGVNGSIEGSNIGVANVGPDGILAAGHDGYTLTEQDVTAFTYNPSESELNGNVSFSEPYLTTDNQIIIDRTIKKLVWYDDEIVNESIIVGGTEEEPAIIEVNGTVWVNGTITVTSGYVSIIEGEGYEGVLQKGTNCSRILNVKLGAHATINGLDFQSSSNRNTYGVAVDYEAYCDVINTNISGFDSGISTGGYLTVNGGTISGCRRGISTAGNSFNHIAECSITGNEYGIYNTSSWYDNIEDGTSITNNSTADYYVYSTSFGLRLRGAVEIEKVDMKFSSSPVYVAGSIEGSHIGVTNDDGDGIIAMGTEGYTLTESDVHAFTYSPSAAELNGNVSFSDPYLTADNQIKVDKTTGGIVWNDGDIIEETTLNGGTEEAPLIVTVNGMVTINGTITVTSGYVNFVEGEGCTGVLLKGTNCSRILTVKYGAHATINGLDFQSSSNRNTYGAIAEYGAYVDVINANITGFDSGISTGGYLTVNGGTISGCRRGISTGTNSFNHIAECSITGNEYGIYNNSSWYDYIEDGTSVTNNSTADYYVYDTSFGLYVQGAFEIGKADFNLRSSSISVIGSIAGSDIEVTNAAGEGILAVGREGYTLTEQDLASFTYTPSESQLNGNGIYSQPYLDTANNRIQIDISYKTYIPLGGVGGDAGYYISPATAEGLNSKDYTIQNDNNGYYYEIKEGDSVFFQIDVKEGYDAEGLAVTVTNGDETVQADLYTAEELQEAFDIEFTPEEGTENSRLYCRITVENETEIVVDVSLDRLDGVAQIYGGSLTLDGEIGVNIYVTIPDAVFADKGAYAMVNDKKVLLGEAPYQTSGGMKLYKFSYFLQSTQMNDAVVLRLYGSDDSLITLYSFAGEEITENGYSYSVRDYINRVTASYTQSPKLKALVNALSDYGSLAQVQFGYHADQAAAIVEQEALDAVTLETLEPLAYTTEGTLPEGLGYYGSNLVLDSKTTLKHYFTLGSGHDISEYRFTVGGEEYTPERAGTYYYVEIPNITAKDLDERYPVRISPAGDDSAYYELSYSALSYARQVMVHSSDNNLRQLVKGLYLYSLAAEAYFDK